MLLETTNSSGAISYLRNFKFSGVIAHTVIALAHASLYSPVLALIGKQNHTSLSNHEQTIIWITVRCNNQPTFLQSYSIILQSSKAHCQYFPNLHPTFLYCSSALVQLHTYFIHEIRPCLYIFFKMDINFIILKKF